MVVLLFSQELIGVAVIKLIIKALKIERQSDVTEDNLEKKSELF